MDTLVSLAGQFPLLGSVRDSHPLADIHASLTKHGTAFEKRALLFYAFCKYCFQKITYNDIATFMQ
jgi:hypothetical protein